MATSSLKEIYQGIERDFTALLGEGRSLPRLSAESSLIAVLKERRPLISWIGYYWELQPGSRRLWVGAYQGPLACLEIPPGKGVCGTSFEEEKILIVPDVETFPGHIACDAKSRSEIVLPVYVGGRIRGVLDLDSHEPDAFCEEDAVFISKLLDLIDQKTNSPS